MHIEFLVEEASAEAALANLLPRMLGPGHTFGIHAHQGKSDLLARLPGKLRGYRSWLPSDWRIVVLIDEDREDCARLKGRLEQAAREAGLTTKSAPGSDGRFCVLNRLAVEELEAWFLGDVAALVATFPRLPSTLDHMARFRDPDAVPGGTWEALERVLQKAGYYPGGLPRVEFARRVSRYMDPQRNRSRSFRVFRQGLSEVLSCEAQVRE